MNHIRVPLLLISVLIFSTLTSQTEMPDDISFINGTWQGKVVDVGTTCLKAQLQAVSDVNFTGNIQGYDNCLATITDNCSISGTVSGLNLTTTIHCTAGGGDTCNASGAFNSNLSSFTVKGNCNQPTTITLTKTHSAHDVSLTSGVGVNKIQTNTLQWVDYNNDKKVDLYLVGRNGNALFKNNGGGKFVDVTAQTKTGNNGKDARGASWADVDNDGDQDVFIANASVAPTLLLNQRGVFQDVSSKLSMGVGPHNGPFIPYDVNTRGGVWVDINNDKDVDLYVVRDGGPNILYKQHALTFQEIASKAGVALNSHGRSVVTADFNGDGFQDLYVVNFHAANRLFVNNGNETFHDTTGSAGVGFVGGSTQALLVDYDQDQKVDIFVVNNEGPSFFYRNLGNTKFAKFVPAGVKNAIKGTAAAFVDFDKDGKQDLILAESPQPPGHNFLFQNLGAGKFTAVKGVDFSRPNNPTGVVIADFNGDGSPDIAFGNAGDDTPQNGDSLFQNTGGGGNNYLILTLQGTQSNRNAIGASVTIGAGGKFQTREVTSGNGQSQEGLPLSFGIGTANIIDQLIVLWPSGARTNMVNVQPNRTLALVEPK